MQIDYSVPGCTFVFGYLFLHEQKQTCEINKMAAEKYNTKSVIINILSITQYLSYNAVQAFYDALKLAKDTFFQVKGVQSIKGVVSYCH